MRFPFCVVFLLSILLLACQTKPAIEEIKVEKLAESSLSWNGDSLPPYPQGQPKITILKVSIPPNQQLEMHEHLVINAGVLLKGEVTVISEMGDSLRLKAGDPIIEMVNTFHYGINEGDEVAEIIVVYAGDVDTPITQIKK
ncbi:cupin domain-containing protein [Algoriphagus namhaensis]